MPERELERGGGEGKGLGAMAPSRPRVRAMPPLARPPPQGLEARTPFSQKKHTQ